MLKRGEVDAVIVAEPFDEPGVVTYPLYDELLCGGYAQNPSPGQAQTIGSAELANESVLLLTQGNCFRDQVLSCGDRLQQPAAPGGRALSRTLSATTIRHMVAGGGHHRDASDRWARG